MDLELTGRVVLVTGGSSGIGQAAAAAIAAEGAKVVLCARREAPLARAAREMGAEAVRADVMRATDVRRLVAFVRRRHGRLDGLVHAAGGVRRFTRFAETPLAEWRHALEWNLLGAVAVVQACLPFLRRSDAARIVLVASEVGRQPYARAPHYSAAKAGLLCLSKFLANELARDGVLVNAVCPGPVESESWARQAGGDSNAFRRLLRAAARRVPLGRAGRPGEVAPWIALLVSPRNTWTTGAAISIDGGAVKGVH